MSTSRLDNATVVEYLAQVDSDADAMEASMSGSLSQKDTDLFNSPNFIELVHILLADPMLVVPCLNWLHQKQAIIATAKLEALYSPEELAALRKSLPES